MLAIRTKKKFQFQARKSAKLAENKLISRNALKYSK